MIQRVVLLFIFLFLNFSFAISYKFYHYPISNIKIYFGKKYGWQYVKYIGEVKDGFLKKVDFSEIFNEINTLKYINFLRYSYWWYDTFSNIKDNKIDLSYLDEKKLPYPILAFGINYKLVFFIPEYLLSFSDKDFIRSKYYSKNFQIIKYKNLYVVVLSKEYSLPYFKTHKYITILSRILDKNFKVISFQIGQNPLSKIYIQGFSNDILWLEVLKGNKLIGVILDLFPKFSPKVEFSQEFIKDEEMVASLYELYEAIKKYYHMMGGMPQDLGSLFPNFYDITEFNRRGYKTKYELLGVNLAKVCFVPKSKEFRSLYWFELEKGGWRCYYIEF